MSILLSFFSFLFPENYSLVVWAGKPQKVSSACGSRRFCILILFLCHSFAEELREHFGQYGDIESINVKTDPQTGRSRGFAFIVYAAAESIDKVTAAGEHIINNKKVDPKKAKARHGKIFVGGLTTEISDDEIKAFFGQFGNVSYCFFMGFLFHFLVIIFVI